jgi:hypothetical protein
MVELRMTRFPAAIADYTAALAADPYQPSAKFGRGLAHLWLGQMAAGSTDIIAARKSDPEIDSMFVILGVLPQQCGSAKSRCPAGFPEIGTTPSYQAVVMKSYSEESDLAAIEAGRLEVMVDQIALLLKQPVPRRDGEALSRVNLPAHLSLTVARFNTLLPLACHARQLPSMNCIVWHPAWLNAFVPDPVVAVDDAYLHIRPIWVALCAANKRACRIE